MASNYVGNLRRAFGAPGRDAGDPGPGLRQRDDRLRGHALHRARHADRAGTRAAAPPPITVGGVGEKYTLPLVARYADVWNVPTYALGELEYKVSVLRSICEDIGRDPATIVMSVEAVMALAPDDASLPKVRQVAERRFGGPGFSPHDGGLIGTPPLIVERLNESQELGFGQVVLFIHDRASDATIELLASTIIPELGP